MPKPIWCTHCWTYKREFFPAALAFGDEKLCLASVRELELNPEDGEPITQPVAPPPRMEVSRTVAPVLAGDVVRLGRERQKRESDHPAHAVNSTEEKTVRSPKEKKKCGLRGDDPLRQPSQRMQAMPHPRRV